MIRRLLFPLLLFVMLSSPPCNAQETPHNIFGGNPQPVAATPSPTASPVSTAAPSKSPRAASSPEVALDDLLTQQRDRRISLLKLQSQLDQLAFDHEQSLHARSSLVQDYEEIATLYCFPNVVRSGADSARPRSAQCLEYATLLASLDPKNLVAICIRDGIHSSTCRQGFEAQKVVMYTAQRVMSSEAKILELEQGDQGRRLDEKSSALRNDLLSIAAQKARQLSLIQGRASAEERAQLKKIELKLERGYANLLAMNCKLVGLELTGEEYSTMQFPRHPVMSAFGEKPTPTPTPSLIFQRNRLITERCMNAISAARKVYPNFAPAICHEIGFYSPQCLDALVIHRKRLEQLKKDDFVPGRNKGGMVEF